MFCFIATAILFSWLKLSIWNQVMLHLNHSVALHFTEFFCRCKNSHNSWINIILILELDELDEGSLSWMIFRHDKYYNNIDIIGIAESIWNSKTKSALLQNISELLQIWDKMSTLFYCNDFQQILDSDQNIMIQVKFWRFLWKHQSVLMTYPCKYCQNADSQ